MTGNPDCQSTNNTLKNINNIIIEINSKYQREKYCTLFMFQWNQPKSYNYLMQNTFPQSQGFIITGTPDWQCTNNTLNI